MRQAPKFLKVKSDSIKLINLVLKVYVLEAITYTMRLVLEGRCIEAVETFKGVGIVCLHLLKRTNPIVIQILSYTERIANVLENDPRLNTSSDIASVFRMYLQTH